MQDQSTKNQSSASGVPVSQPAAVKPAASQQSQKPQQVHPIQKVVPAQQAVKKPPEKKQFGRKKNGVLFISRQQFFLYIDGMPSIITFPFTVDVVSDLDVINEELLEEKIADIIQQQQLPPADLAVVLSNQTLFSKQVTATDVSQKKVDEEKFVNTIPFETPAVRNITLGSNIYIVVANGQLFGPLNTAFIKNGFECSLVLPEFLFGKELNLTQGLSVASAQIIMKKAQEFKAYSFIRKEVRQEEVTEEGKVVSSKFKLQVSGGKSNRMFVVSGMMVMLVGVLVAAFLFIQQNNTPPLQGAVILEAPTPIQSGPTPGPPSPTTPLLEGQLVATDSAESSSPSASVQGDTSSDITIHYTQSNSRVAYLLTERLRKLGFSAITPQLVLATGESQIAFKPSVSSTIEEIVLTEVEKQIGATTMQRTNSIQNDIVIFVGNQN